MRYALGLIELTETQLIHGDVNEDGVVNIADAIGIMRIAMGLNWFTAQTINWKNQSGIELPENWIRIFAAMKQNGSLDATIRFALAFAMST